MRSFILATAVQLLLPLLLLFSIFLLLRGHNEPGGGFIGGCRNPIPVRFDTNFGGIAVVIMKGVQGAPTSVGDRCTKDQAQQGDKDGFHRILLGGRGEK